MSIHSITQQETIKRLRELPLDQPIVTKYFTWHVCCPLERLFLDEAGGIGLSSSYLVAKSIGAWAETFTRGIDRLKAQRGDDLWDTITPRDCLLQLGVTP